MNLSLKLKIMKLYRSQADFALAVGAQESLVSRVIRGRRELSNEKKRQWAEKLDCNANELFTRRVAL
jgi:transcriptional regulator with XRE-family HTH domain